MGYNKEQAIAAQNAGSTAASLMASAVAAGIVEPDEVGFKRLFNEFRVDVFNGTLGLAGAELTVEVFEGETPQMPSLIPEQPRSFGGARSSGGGGGGGGGGKPNAGSITLKFGKHAGKTLGQVHDEDPTWVEWAAENSTNDFIKKITNEYLAEVA